jgi:hypothetical protein
MTTEPLKTPQAWALARGLLNHHRQITSAVKIAAAADITDDIVNRCTITYGDLGKKVRARYIPRSMGRYLSEVENWCHAHDEWPLLTALVVTKRKKRPGIGYGSPKHWPEEVRSCLSFQGYPKEF